jgi:DNA-binding MarR family transcriptional regulator
VVALTSRCENAGLVARRPGKADKRSVEVFLKPKGERLLRQLALLHMDQLADLQELLKVPGADLLMHVK